MGTPGGGAGFFGGLVKGFGRTFYEQRKRKQEQDLENEAKQFKVMQDAMQVASQRGDTDAVAHILRSMDEFSQGGGHSKGSKRKEAQQGILTKFADMLEGGGVSQGGQQSEQQVNRIMGTPAGAPTGSAPQGQPQEPTPEQQQQLQQVDRPRTVMGQPLFKSNMQLSQEQTAADVARQKALLPGELEKYKGQQSVITAEQQQRKANEIKLKTDQALTVMDAKGKLAANKEIDELTAATGGDRDKAMELWLTKFNAGLSKTQAQTNLMNTRSDFLGKDYQLRRDTLNAKMKRWDELTELGKQAAARGDRALDIKMQTAGPGIKSLNKSIDTDLNQMKNIQSEINRLEGIIANPYNDEKYRESVKMNLADLDKQYTDLRSKVQEKQSKLDESFNDLETKKLGVSGGTTTSGVSTPQKKTLAPQRGKADESGLTKGQEVDGSTYGYPGTTLVYQGLSSDGQAIFKKKKK